MTARAFTLIEVLLVVALTGVAMAMGVGALAGASAAADMAEAGSVMARADRHARVLARTAGPTTLWIDRGHACAMLTGPGERASTLGLPGDVRVDILDRARNPLDALVFHADGRTQDYAVLLTRGEHTRLTHVSGLTGLRTEGDLP